MDIIIPKALVHNSTKGLIITWNENLILILDQITTVWSFSLWSWITDRPVSFKEAPEAEVVEEMPKAVLKENKEQIWLNMGKRLYYLIAKSVTICDYFSAFIASEHVELTAYYPACFGESRGKLNIFRAIVTNMLGQSSPIFLAWGLAEGRGVG